MRKALEVILKIIVIIISISALLFIVDKALEGQEQIDCYRLQKQSKDYKNFMYSPTNIGGFYITKADKEMCDMYNIKIDSVVR